jgi:hypothetical protein
MVNFPLMLDEFLFLKLFRSSETFSVLNIFKRLAELEIGYASPNMFCGQRFLRIGGIFCDQT